MKKKILFCSPIGKVGGICQWTENILAYNSSLVDSDIELDWCYSDLRNEKRPKSNSTLRRIINGWRLYYPMIKEVHRRVHLHHYDSAHFSTSGSISFVRDYLILKACHSRGIRTSLHFHFGRMPEVLAGNSLEKKLFNLCLPYIDNFIAIDEATFTALREYGCENVSYVPNPLTPTVENLINEVLSDREANLVVFAGHVLVTKGVRELVQACKSIPDAKLEILGLCTDAMKAELMGIGGDNSQKWLNIRGNCSLKQVLEAMKRCSVFALPSYTEGFPNVIIEAMACRAPIIATNVGAIPQMLAPMDGKECGTVIPAKDVESLTQALRKLLVDHSVASSMGENAYKKVHECYSMPIVWQKLKEIWLT